MLMNFLINTAVGNVICRVIEHLTGCALVPLDRLEYQVAATDQGRAAARRAREVANG